MRASKSERGRGRPRGRTPTKAYQVRLPIELAEKFDAWLGTRRRPVNTELRMMVERELNQAGLLKG